MKLISGQRSRHASGCVVFVCSVGTVTAVVCTRKSTEWFRIHRETQMRFIPSGPSIPDDLLIARDAGQVLFFCGAGVSRAKANLPDFKALSSRVLDLLGSASDSPARRLFDAAIASEKASNVSGLVPFDRVFGMLEREFEAAEVRAAVAAALQPEPGCSLDAHRTLLDLSRTRGGKPRLVTTNFDLLFEECEPGIESYNPPKLPDPGRDNDFQGVIHLHGRVDEKYQNACDNEFVLSSADFGHAYLSDGWATRYIQALLQHFRIVFVGYSADDPPVQYLLEALNRFRRPAHALYALQSGDHGQAAQQWAHKGVEPISYDGANHHGALWDTLSEWADRARDVDGWHDRLIAKASRGPASMLPHERGMVAHLASTSIGSRRIADPRAKLPADWLFVFDRNERYGQPQRIVLDDSENPFDPFDAFGLDSDPPPLVADLDNAFARRPVPEAAWDGMAVASNDAQALPPAAVARFRSATTHTPELPERLHNLGWWVCLVAHEPAALWWAAAQIPLHSRVRRNIEKLLIHEANRFTPVVRLGWRILLRSWQQTVVDPDTEKYAIENIAKHDGWSAPLVRDAISLYNPYRSVGRSYTRKPPDGSADLRLGDILSVGVEYPRPHEAIEIPADWLQYAAQLFRQNLEHAVELEREHADLDYLYLNSIRADVGDELDEHSHGLTGQVICFVNLIDKLATVDLAAARDEVFHWTAGDPVFTRLRIWACGRSDITQPEEAGRMLLELDDENFWRHAQERDLLFALRDRWNELPCSTIQQIEERLCYGAVPFGEHREDRERLIALHRLDRIQWLANQGIAFKIDHAAVIASLRASAPDWTEESAEHTAMPTVSKVHGIVADYSSQSLEKLPLSEVLEKSQELGAPRFGEGVMRRPFDGLAANRPARALSAITNAAKGGKFYPWAWGALLYADVQSQQSSRLLTTVGHRLARLSPPQLAEVMHPASEWLRTRSERLLSECPKVFDLVWNALVDTLKTAPGIGARQVTDRRWVDESINSTAGRMLETWFNSPRFKGATQETGLPASDLRKLDQMLNLLGEHRQHAIVLIASRLRWLFHVSPDWTRDQVLPIATGTDEQSQAFWAGYLWTGSVPQPPLHSLLKPTLISLAWQADLPRNETTRLAGILLASWGHGGPDTKADECISDVELREILIHARDDLRMSVLWHLQQWVRAPESPFPGRLVQFLSSVWPRQRALRTAALSGKLVDIALSVPARFSEIIPLILQRLVPLRPHSVLLADTNVSSEIFDTSPETLLELLSVVLADDAAEWPYGAGDIIFRLTKLPETQNDHRLAKLLRNQQRRIQ
ncbi:SIR2 family protein [Burkholderia cenocepacia]|uniref:SIR2 family protein n=1 Tax=Burkholderia cenocepacia TaxID=95486 RepID=UPI002237D605|nr:SIR2 family protein [Burkholderia cenocepacia]MCW5115585.1 SIR2 family protein [Burkholderia cenocepacia]MCW5129039.1 SIR2 family protein [Burkholderia cenocepacia]MCW5172037.1 SIR2 family protein [Burkholderia cenocepacia]